MRTHLSLFSGIGGLDLAAEWAGFTTVGQCEWADYPTMVLEKHWPRVPRWRDIRTLTEESFYEHTGLRTVDLVSGGFPCQPFSVAGNQKGKGDDRYLWPEMRRVIAELAPSWVVAENVPGILRIAAHDVVEELECQGYNVVVFDFEAAAVGAPHRRERVAFVAHLADANGEGLQGRKRRIMQECASKRASRTGSTCPGFIETNEAAADTEMWGKQRKIGKGENTRRFSSGSRWATEPDVGRVAHGIPNRVDRLKCIGNAVVPQQFYPIFKAIYDTEVNQCVTN